MKILIDECLPWDLRKGFPGHDCWTVAKAGFAGRKNGELLSLAEQAGFEVLITVDKALRYQQNLHGRRIAVLVITARSNKMSDLEPYLARCSEALSLAKPGQVVNIP